MMSDLITNPAVISAAVAVLLGLVGLLAYRWAWVTDVKAIVIAAYTAAEKIGLTDNLAGYDKLKPFMEELRKLFLERYGREPGNGDLSLAIRILQWLVSNEDKTWFRIENPTPPEPDESSTH